VNSDKKPPSQPNHELGADLGKNPEVDEFFTRMNYGMRRPKPGQEAIAAAFEAIQRLALEVDTEESVNQAEQNPSAQNQCGVCGAQNRPQNRFCASCGVPLYQSHSLPTEPENTEEESTALIPSQEHRIRREPPGQHHYHHHYHHHYFASCEAGFAPGPEMGTGAGPRENTVMRAPLTGPSLSRAEVGIRKMSQDWALACNTKQLDDIVNLYTSDALVLRPNVPPIRGTASIREFFFTALDSGFGEVELEPVRVEIFGEIAYEAGRCKALVPSALGKRREERGKYLVLSTRQSGEWRILSDCWSADLSLGIVGETLPAKPGAPGSNSRLPRKP
jgi:ketosteroid isomerase-like protein